MQDPGLTAYLTGSDTSALELDISSALTGGIVEGFVVSELLKQESWSSIDFNMYHFRDSQAREVDIMLENKRQEVVGIEAKHQQRFSARIFVD